MQTLALYEGNLLEFKKHYLQVEDDIKVEFETGDVVVADSIDLKPLRNGRYNITITLLTEEVLIATDIVDYNKWLKRLFKIKRKT